MGQETDLDLADTLVTEMSADNGCRFEPTPDEKRELADAVGAMRRAGCPFTQDDIIQLVAGEVSERDAAYSKFDGFAELDAVLNKIFDGG